MSRMPKSRPRPATAPAVRWEFKAQAVHLVLQDVKWSARRLRYGFDRGRATPLGRAARADRTGLPDWAQETAAQRSRWPAISDQHVGQSVGIPDDVFYRVQAILTGRVQTSGPYQRRRPDPPLTGVHQVRGVRTGPHRQLVEGPQCAVRRSYHCLPPCRAVNIPKARLEGLFADELARFQPTPGYMRLLKESVLRVWHDRKASVNEEIASAEHRTKVIRAEA